MQESQRLTQFAYARLGERYSGPNHDRAADVLDRVGKELGSALHSLNRLKTESQYGDERSSTPPEKWLFAAPAHS